MTLLFMDSFDHYSSSEFDKKYESLNLGSPIIGAGGRNGTNAFISTTDTIGKTIPNTNPFIVGFAFYTSVFATSQRIIRFLDSVSVQCTLWTDGSGHILVRNGDSGAIQGTSTESFNTLTWYYIEAKITIDNSSGVAEIRVNGDTIINATGIDTQTTANAYIDQVELGYRPNTNYYDDFYICDTNGDAPQNNFLGDVRVEAIFPDSSGTYAQWQVTGSASNYLAVDDDTPDTTTYTYATGSSLKDAFSMGDSSIGDGTIYGIQPLLYARKDDAGSVLINPVARINGLDYTLGTGSFSLSDSYTYYRSIEEVNPDTSGSWTLSDINNIEFGYNRSG